MSEQNEFDARLAARFEREHSHVSADPFVSTTMRMVRAGRRRRERMRIGLYAAVLVGAVVASPWLIAGVTRLNAGIEFFLAWSTEQLGGWVLGAMAVLAVLATRVRSR